MDEKSVESWMSRKVISVEPECPVAEVLNKMHAYRALGLDADDLPTHQGLDRLLVHQVSPARESWAFSPIVSGALGLKAMGGGTHDPEERPVQSSCISAGGIARWSEVGRLRMWPALIILLLLMPAGVGAGRVTRLLRSSPKGAAVNSQGRKPLD